jgi:hypothetical protein
MKKVLFTIAVLALSTASLAGNKLYAITNEDNPNGNTATVFVSTAGGPITVSQTLKTGGDGLGGGYFANNRLTAQVNGDCLFVSDAGTEDIAAFKGTYDRKTEKLTFNPSATRTPTGGSGSMYGVGLAERPQNDLLFATLDENEEIGIFTVGPGCKLTAVGTVPENDLVGPMAVTKDGGTLVVSGPNKSYIDAWTISTTPPYLSPLGSPVVLNGLLVNCSVGCYPTGLDTDKVDSSGNVQVVAGNATLDAGTGSAPYYITVTLNERTGLSQSSANIFLLRNTTLANIETPWYSSSAHDDLYTGWIYFGAAGFGTGYPAGFTVNRVVARAIDSTATQSLVNSSAFYASNVQSTGHQGIPRNEYVWQSGVNSSLNNTMNLYSISGNSGAVSLVQSLPNPNAQGNTYVLTLVAFPGRHGTNK